MPVKYFVLPSLAHQRYSSPSMPGVRSVPPLLVWVGLTSEQEAFTGVGLNVAVYAPPAAADSAIS